MTNLSHWNDIESHLSTADNQTKGELFEQLTEHFLRWSPKYQVILKHVWRLKDVPTNIREKLKIPNQDQGIDLIAESYEGKYWAIQCKYHGDYNKKISHREISTFLALSNAVASNIDFCLVATTADDYAQLYKGQNNIGFILSDTWTQLPASFFDQFQKKEIVKPVTRNPRPHQKDAIIEAKKHFKVETRGKLIFPCGAGKSLTGYWITKELKAKTVIVAVPSLALVKQTLEDYCQESFAEGNPIAPFCICSDEGIGKNDDVVVFTQDLGVVCTTDKVKILDFLNFKTKRTKVLFTTYQSGRVLGDAVNEVNFKFDVGIMDESHKTVGATDKLFSHLLFDENVAIKKRIFMTATERRYKGSSENILSMDDPSVYGYTFTQLSFKEAIRQEILSDYKILTLVITQAEIKEYLNKNDFVKALGLGWEKDIDFRTLSSLVALRKAMHKFPIKHAVTFHSSIKRAKVFEQLQPIFDQAFPAFESVDAFHVTGAIPTSQRSKIIAEFSQSDRGIITNAKCLTEGVDVPNIDCVLFADPRKSSIDIVQAVGRALRRSKGKDFGYVLLPVFAESNDKESIIESEDFQAILQTLRALAANDARIIEYFREKQKTEIKSEKSDLVQFEIDEIIGNEIATDELLNHIEIQAWNRLAKLSWRPYDMAKDYVRSMNLNDNREWRKFTKSKKFPRDIPTKPDLTYSNHWRGWGDWLGYAERSLRKKVILPYAEAKKYIANFKIKNGKSWVDFTKAMAFPSDIIPKAPQYYYKDNGWVNWGDFLGTGFVSIKDREYKSFELAKKFASSLNLNSMSQWRKYCKGEYSNLPKKPDDIPVAVSEIYKNEGWKGFPDFLNSRYVYDDNKYSFFEAKDIIQSLGLKSTKEYNDFINGSSRFDLKKFKGLQAYAKDENWQGTSNFLGTYNKNTTILKHSYFEYNEAKKFVKKTYPNVLNYTHWIKIIKQINRENWPAKLPRYPKKIYKKNGWIDWADFLGKGNEI